MKVFVTGGAGFLGINLVRHLLANGAEKVASYDIAEFDYPEKDKGLVQIFRREDSPFVSAEFALSGLDKDASYRLYDLDDGDMGTFTGKELMKGRLYTVAEKPAAKIIIYAKAK